MRGGILLAEMKYILSVIELSDDEDICLDNFFFFDSYSYYYFWWTKAKEKELDPLLRGELSFACDLYLSTFDSLVGGK